MSFHVLDTPAFLLFTTTITPGLAEVTKILLHTRLMPATSQLLSGCAVGLTPPYTQPLKPECPLGNVLFSRAPFASENGIRCFASRIWAREISIFVPRPRHITYPGITAWLGI